MALKEPVWWWGDVGFGCSSRVSLISQPHRNRNKLEVSAIPGGRDVTQRHTGFFAGVEEVATLGTTNSQ